MRNPDAFHFYSTFVYHILYMKITSLATSDDNFGIHDDFQFLGSQLRIYHIAWWWHQMETFSTLQTLCEGNPPGTDGFPWQRPVTRNSDTFFDVRCVWTNGWVNNRDAGDLKGHRAHFDITVMAYRTNEVQTIFIRTFFSWYSLYRCNIYSSNVLRS